MYTVEESRSSKPNGAAANLAGASWLQSLRPVRRVAELLSFGVASAFVKLALIFFSLIQFLAGCSRHNTAGPISGDTEIRKKMIGTWFWADTSEVGVYLKGAFTVESNGSYVCVIERTFSNATPRRIELHGTQEIKDGIRIDTITKSTITNDQLPRISRARVIRIDDRELVLRLEGEEKDITMTRVNQ